MARSRLYDDAGNLIPEQVLDNTISAMDASAPEAITAQSVDILSSSEPGRCYILHLTLGDNQARMDTLFIDRGAGSADVIIMSDPASFAEDDALLAAIFDSLQPVPAED